MEISRNGGEANKTTVKRVHFSQQTNESCEKSVDGGKVQFKKLNFPGFHPMKNAVFKSILHNRSERSPVDAQAIERANTEKAVKFVSTSNEVSAILRIFSEKLGYILNSMTTIYDRTIRRKCHRIFRGWLLLISSINKAMRPPTSWHLLDFQNFSPEVKHFSATPLQIRPYFSNSHVVRLRLWKSKIRALLDFSNPSIFGLITFLCVLRC